MTDYLRIVYCFDATNGRWVKYLTPKFIRIFLGDEPLWEPQGFYGSYECPYCGVMTPHHHFIDRKGYAHPASAPSSPPGLQ